MYRNFLYFIALQKTTFYISNNVCSSNTAVSKLFTDNYRKHVPSQALSHTLNDTKT